jgi:hypothetical protein
MPEQLIDAEHVRCGDVFEFHGGRYVALGQHTDERHVSTVIFALSEERCHAPVDEVQPFRLLRTFPLRVLARGRYTLKPVLENTDAEVKNCPHPRQKRDGSPYCQLSF